MGSHVEGVSADTKHEEVCSSLLNKQPTKNGPKFGKRHSQVIILMAVVFWSSVIKTSLSVAIVAMTDPTVSLNKNIPTYNWTDKSLVLASLLWGYCIPQVGAGYLADRYGGKWFLVITTLITSTCGLLIPITAATFGSKGVMGCRFIQGLALGFIYPCLHGILSKWIPANERSRLGTLVYSGATSGIVASMLLTGYISASPYGWPFVFYLFNTITILVAGIYAYVGSNEPSSHPTITQEEKNYIETNLNILEDRRELSTPWKKMLSSLPFAAIMVTNIAFNYTYWTLVAETPIYMSKIMNFDLKSNGVLSSIPYIVEVFVGFAASFVADHLSSKNIISTTLLRKIMNNIGLVTPSICFLILGTIEPKHVNVIIAVLIIVIASQGTGKSGYIVNHMDLAPNFSGVMMGLTNGASIIFSAFAPMLAHIVVKDEKNVNQWKIIFLISMCINIFGFIINTIFTSGNRQVWNEGAMKRKGAENN